MHIEIVLTLQRDTTIVIILVKFNQEIYIIVADTNLFKNYYTPCIASLYVNVEDGNSQIFVEVY